MGEARDLSIDPDITRARTPPGSFYTDPAWFDLCRERVLARSWHLLADADAVAPPNHCLPATLLPGVLDEPLLFTREDGARGDAVLRCLSNVCTHRGNILCEAAASGPVLRCRYHGRRFALDGRMLAAPEFEGAADFPTVDDDLHAVPHARWSKLLFAALEPSPPFAELVAELQARVSWLPIERAVLDPERSRDYSVPAHWALYCDNYLEGFHVPYVHPSLAGALDYGSYRTELFRWSSVQVGIASGGDEAVFDLPRGSPDFGQRVAGYYFWLFPCTMVNVYPWGLSVNAVRPAALDRTVVSFLTYVWDRSRLDKGAGAGLHGVELEDEAVVQSVQRGVRSRLYRRGRYSPSREQGVHHFHRLLAQRLGGA
jgi:choline monooxygenase